ncbi:MAG: hypothetical protein Q8P41_15925 [Pseudomonadota bacterium]|nr:hypothetical protein [Pseudomonadota bacterium]
MLFPSQGFETPGMGLARADADAHAARLLDVVSGLVDIDARAVLAGGGPAFRRQEVVQALTLAVSLGSVHDVPDVAYAAGHSLGEFGAVLFAGGVDVDAGLAFAAARGRAMGEAARRAPGGIVAIRADAEAVAAHNTPTGWSMCGPPAALAALGRRTRATPVTNAGAWHHPSHAALAPAVRDALAGVRFRPMRVGVVSAHGGGGGGGSEGLPANLTEDVAAGRLVTNAHPWGGGLVAADPWGGRSEGLVTAADLPDLLVTQLSTPVRWVRAVRRLVALGVGEVIVAEPSRHLAAMVREIAPALRVVSAAGGWA